MRLWAVAVFILGCSPMVPCDVPGSFDSIMAWHREPTIGVMEGSEELEPMVLQGIEDWGWGRYLGDCNDVDICVRKGEMSSETPYGLAKRKQGTLQCEIIMYVDWYRIAAHELGHCYGLDHSEQDDSIMRARYHQKMQVTEQDLDTLHAINNQCLGF